MKNQISKITRSAVIEKLHRDLPEFYGRVHVIDFWNRIFNLKNFASTDSRYDNAEGDISCHIGFGDWKSDWYIEYFNLLNVDDKKFLEFLSEMFHPEVREYDNGTRKTIGDVNKLLSYDGVALYAKDHLSGRPIWGARLIDPSDVPEDMDIEHRELSIGATARIATPRRQLVTINLNSELYEYISPILKKDDYYHAVFEAFKFVIDKLKKMTGGKKAVTFFGENALGAAKDRKYTNYKSIFKRLPSNESEEDFFRGVGYLNLAIEFFRNEKSHGMMDNSTNRNRSLHYITLASLAYDLITEHENDVKNIGDIIV
ncbi:MAG: TIGR02391 family protein [Candidatus Nomurabacteria bacterium]|jgi:uncharacterized protein (TIGR02391 family)|nr:TIGR02391 family protein [Candidatus Nomurabacteria bacterium]